MRNILDEVLLHGQNAATLDAAHILLRTLSSDKRLASATKSSSAMDEILEEKGFGGLWRSCSVGSMDDIQHDCFQLTERLIEVSIWYILHLSCMKMTLILNEQLIII